ncbi:predicted protein [Naegleria gruberi]|uniref:Predicted protein n=1 Tax=Naegleria gruberi TaxID=5762 RepID=D2UXI9_NAEGR|nr:uncharacterized protein NAEGRDRAFT_61140 [Naegleria gruberi]EFC50293.1 predicted protein [Naegleria gruberi]|eukprot:XP_002683037.1 predicted protein [Naegleria gruberi strain NEG-M]
MDVLKEKQFMITSERWQLLEKERLEILRKRELIEHRIDLRYHSEEGLEQHRSDYYKRLLKKVEDNLEKSKIRNKLLVNKADDLLQSVSVSNSNNLVKSKVKLEVAKKQFLQSFQDRVKEYEELGRHQKLKQIRKTEEEIEIERRKLRESTLEWEREKKVNNDLQEKIKELIVTKEISKKEAIEREAERKAILEGERKIQRAVEQTSVDASKRYLEKEEKRKLEAVDGKDIKYKGKKKLETSLILTTLTGLVEEVYEGKIGIAAREKFVSQESFEIQSQQVQKPVDELYYNDGYSSFEEKHNPNSFAKFKEWQKKQTVDKKKPEMSQTQKPKHQTQQQTPITQPMRENCVEKNYRQEEFKEIKPAREDYKEIKHEVREEEIKPTPVSQTTKDVLGDSIGSIEDRESESDDITKSFLESIKKPMLVSALSKKDDKTSPISSMIKPSSPKNIVITPEETKNNNFVKIQSPKSFTSTSPQQNRTNQTFANQQATSISPTKSTPPPNPVIEKKKEIETKKDPEKDPVEHKEGDSKTKKIKSFFSAAFKFNGKKKEEEKSEETESSSENDSNAQDKEGDNMVQQRVKKLNQSKLVTTLSSYMLELENHLKEQKERYNKMSLNYKLENKESQETLVYSNCPKINGKNRVLNIESSKKEIEPVMKCVACLDIIQYLPSPLISVEILDEYLEKDTEYEIEQLSKYLNSFGLEVWRLIITHVSNLSKLEPKWREPLLKVFSESICKTLPPSKNTTEAKNKTKTLLKTYISTKKSNTTIPDTTTLEQPKKK